MPPTTLNSEEPEYPCFRNEAPPFQMAQSQPFIPPHPPVNKQYISSTIIRKRPARPSHRFLAF